jgi:hypothetical protein
MVVMVVVVVAVAVVVAVRKNTSEAAALCLVRQFIIRALTYKIKLTWLVLERDPAAYPHKVE